MLKTDPKRDGCPFNIGVTSPSFGGNSSRTTVVFFHSGKGNCIRKHDSTCHAFALNTATNIASAELTFITDESPTCFC